VLVVSCISTRTGCTWISASLVPCFSTRAGRRIAAPRSSPACVRATFSSRIRRTMGRRATAGAEAGTSMKRGGSSVHAQSPTSATFVSRRDQQVLGPRDARAPLELAGFDQVEEVQVLGALAHDLLPAALGAVLEQAPAARSRGGSHRRGTGLPEPPTILRGRSRDLEDFCIRRRFSPRRGVSLALAQPRDGVGASDNRRSQGCGLVSERKWKLFS
jgi:hypothetical protein